MRVSSLRQEAEAPSKQNLTFSELLTELKRVSALVIYFYSFSAALFLSCFIRKRRDDG